MTLAANFATSFASVVVYDTGSKFAAGVNNAGGNDTGGNDTGGNDTGGNFATGVNDTGGK